MMHESPRNRVLIAPAAGATPTLAYVRPGALAARPALLTAVAVSSLIFASGSFLAGVFSLLFHAGLWWLEPARPTFVAPPPLAPVAIEAYAGDPAGIDGLRRAPRDAVVEHLRRQLSLPADRAEMLRRLLADVGAQMFPRGARLDPFDPGLIAGAGRVERGADRAHYFVTSCGRVELSDFTATFLSDGATTPPRHVRIVRNVLYDGDAPPRWSALAIGEALDEANARCGGILSGYQGAMLLRELRARQATEPDSWRVRPQIAQLVVWQRGTLSYRSVLPERPVTQRWLLPDGRTASFAAAPHGIDPVTAVPYVRVPPPAYRYWPGSRGAVALLAVEGMLSAILAAYLFIGAILLLRQLPGGAERHVQFILLKVPLVLIAAFALLWWRMSLSDYVALPRPAAAVARMSWLLATGMLLYPAALVLALRAPRIGYYFATRRQDPWHPLRQGHSLVQRLPARRTLGLAMLVLAGLHLAAAGWCLIGVRHAPVQGLLHGFGAIVAGAIALVLLIRWGRAVRVRGVALAAVVLACCGWPAAQAGGGVPLSPWGVEDLLVQAQGPSEPAAREAVRKLARGREAGQEALLRLLEGPVPPIGIGGILDGIGDEWLDSDIQWTSHYRPRALRLLPEWIESIERASDARRMAALEAMGTDQDIEPLLRPLLTAPGRDIRRRAARYLLTINPHPAGMVRRLERDLRLARDLEHETFIEALVNLRPASDPALQRVLLDPRGALVAPVLAAMLEDDHPLSPELFPVMEHLLGCNVATVERRAARLLARSREGRARLIERSTGDTSAATAAREALEEAWPATEPVHRRLSQSARGETRAALVAAAMRVLRAVNDDQDLAALADAAGSDDELRGQALMVLADGEYATRLGPVTFRMVDGSGEAAPPPPWQSAPPPRWERGFTPTMPLWASIVLWGPVVVALLALAGGFAGAGGLLSRRPPMG